MITIDWNRLIFGMSYFLIKTRFGRNIIHRQVGNEKENAQCTRVSYNRNSYRFHGRIFAISICVMYQSNWSLNIPLPPPPHPTPPRALNAWRIGHPWNHSTGDRNSLSSSIEIGPKILGDTTYLRSEWRKGWSLFESNLPCSSIHLEYMYLSTAKSNTPYQLSQRLRARNCSTVLGLWTSPWRWSCELARRNWAIMGTSL